MFVRMKKGLVASLSKKEVVEFCRQRFPQFMRMVEELGGRDSYYQYLEERR